MFHNHFEFKWINLLCYSGVALELVCLQLLCEMLHPCRILYQVYLGKFLRKNPSQNFKTSTLQHFKTSKNLSFFVTPCKKKKRYIFFMAVDLWVDALGFQRIFFDPFDHTAYTEVKYAKYTTN